MATHQLHVFISHSWTYSGHYDKLASWIFDGGKWGFGQASIQFRNYSVPKDSPIHNARNATQLKEAIYDKIARSHVIVIPTGMYANYSNWIQKEIDGSREKGKPILAVNPWAQQRTSSVVSNAADKTVGWNRDSIIRGIWDLHYR